MRVISTRYRTVKRLEDFIKKNIVDDCKIYVKLILPNFALDEFNTIKELLKKYAIKEKNIFAIKSDESVLNGGLVKDIVINFIMIDSNDSSLTFYQNLYDIKNFESGYFYILYSIDLDKEKFLNIVDKNIELIGTFYHDKIIYDGKKRHSGFLILKLERYFDVDIKVINSITPIGRELKVDKADKNILKFVEGMSVKNLYEHYLTKTLSKDLKKASYTFPLLKEEKSSLILQENKEEIELEYSVNSGDILKLGYTSSSSFYNLYEKRVKEFKDNYSDTFFLIYSVARESFFKENGFEYDEAVGFQSRSELVVFKGRVYDLTHSIVMININSQNKNRLRYKRFKPLKMGVDAIVELDALSNIAKVSSNELEALNKKLEKRVKQEVEKNLKKDSIMIHQTRLAQMGEMLSLIAHQWKQPLSAISATSSGLHIKIELDMYDKEFFLNSLTKIEEFVNHLSTTIDDFSNFFKPSKKKKEFFIYEAIDKALSIATYSLSKKSIDLVLDIDKSLKVKTYQNELVQVLLNLIKNAENILVKREIKEPKIWIKVFKRGDEKVIQICDNAKGIDKKILPKIFEPYFSTKATKDSTGLGLYMSKFIIEDSLGGKLEAKNDEKGAVFSIILV
jgi:signal transduction histidine kinase